MAIRIAIIGAGVAGCGAARRAAELGADVTLIEQNHPGTGSSGRSAGVYNIQTLDPLDVEIRIHARELFFRLERDRGLHLSRIGNVRVATDESQLPRLQAVIDLQHQLGADDSILLDRDGLHRLVPDLNVTDLVGGLLGPNDGHLDGQQLCDVLLAEATESGATLRSRTKVTGHHVTPDGHHALQLDGEVDTFDLVINAAGGWAGKVGVLLGHPVPLLPQVHEVVQVKLPHQLDYVVPMVNLYMPGQAGEALYFRQDGPDSLIAGMHTYTVLDHIAVADPDDYRTKVSEEYLYEVAEHLTERFRVDGLGFKPGWTGIYPLSPDSRFILGPESDPTVVTCAGLGGVGVTMGAIAGATAAEWALNGTPTTVPSTIALRPDRESLDAFRNQPNHSEVRT
ncbi:FAD-binding oxidoreductase [Phycicoccus sp. Soil803]|uniref:NAD(P)/FAD-dependent oxidoreductase n=1 Tax=Phycicoccus sp. Soil803 TaxID=1736415 RepID=UPI0007094479|nr:FAD-dependent oxidoreductase [Phycicoccus sp. Soil803]KRF24411.1 FAD-dependent oxidoreductase [Phycicoccus sp. Soil803]